MSRIDIGHGVTIRCFEQDCVIHGIEHTHTSPLDGFPCVAHISLAHKPEWPDGLTMEQKVPLTIVEAIKCERCGLRGFIREGKWAQS